MILYNKTILLPNLDALTDVLINNENPNLYTCNCVYEERIAIQHHIQKGMHNIRIWRTKSLFDFWFNDFHYSGRNFIASLDYTIHKNFIKIEHLGINDREPVNLRLYDNSFDCDDAEDIIKYLIHFVKMVGKRENKSKIILDVHENFRLYEKYYYYEGFKITERKSKGNPFWIETEIIL